MDFIHHHDKYSFPSAHQISNILPLQDLSSQSLSPFLYTSQTSSDLNSADSDEIKESVSLAKQSKKISKQEPEAQQQKAASKRGLWSSSEDAKLVSLVEEYGQKWTKISEMMPQKGRKQVRDRYLNALRPGINWGEWTKEEDNQFEILHERFGNKWCEIAAHLPGRTENQVKNKYYWKRSQQPKQNATTSRKYKGKTDAKNVKPSSKVQAKQLEETETVSKSQAESFNLLETEVAIQQHSVYLYNDVDAYFCF